MNRSVLALCGALAGGALGYLAFFWVVAHGFYALVLPGGLLGFGAGIVRTRSPWVAVVCGLSAIVLGLFTEYRFAPFAKDPSFSFFLAHVHHLNAVPLILIAVGGMLGFWIPFRRVEPGHPPTKTNDSEGSETPKA